MYSTLKSILVTITLVFTNLSYSQKSIVNKLITNNNYNFIEIDNASDKLIEKHKIYNRSDAFALRDLLEQQVRENPNSLVLSLALVKFHTNARNANGGFMGVALLYATHIYKLNKYIGCLTFEYIYYKNGDLKNSRTWYNNSLSCLLEPGTEWRIVKEITTPPISTSLYGSTSNYKNLPLYETDWGSHQRRMMVPKCTGDCSYTVVSDYLSPSKIIQSKLAYQNF